ncbi:lysozyme inhibitor LprI family protein [Pandoraea commovens]|uniref:Lipoprotein LprI n=1 Tax=Pandoraea commovens TaxID=2508289 RepID=A0A5E4W8R5_9BURK|nr:lysozyme inhibitor LprI family protein [Pandoraea commovens]VVE21028.1 Lipoprotein LprI [Pandoraea commovens]
MKIFNSKYQISIRCAVVALMSVNLGVVSAQTVQPSFDCRKASSSVERSICASPSLAESDNQLAQAFTAATNRTADKAGLRKDQNKWRATVRDKCRSDECIANAYRERTRALRVSAENGRVLTFPRTGDASPPSKTSVFSGAVLYGTLVFDHDLAGGFVALQVGDRQYKLRYVWDVPETLQAQIQRLEDSAQMVSVIGDLIAWPDGTKSVDDRSPVALLVPKQ